MEFYIANLIYFVIVIPIVVLFFLILSKLREKEKISSIIVILSLLLFIVRVFLIFFQDTIGIMPYLIEDVFFYGFLMIFGIFFTWFYTIRIEKVSFKKIGGRIKNIKKSVIYGLVAYIPLVSLIPLILFLTSVQISINLSFGKVIVAICFAVLGEFFEEVMFRGIIQNHLMELLDNNEKKTIILTALIFTATHLFYLPFIGFGIFYLFVFIMSLILSTLRAKLDLLACALLHGGIVFILIIFT